jgi:cytochrome P450
MAQIAGRSFAGGNSRRGNIALYFPVMVGTGRWASEDIEMHGTAIAKGDMVWISLMAANTDPERFSAPEELDITREENEHL